MCPSSFCDIFRCHHYLPVNASLYDEDSLLEGIHENSLLFDLFYPDLGLGNGPPRPVGREVAPAPPRTMLDLLNLQAAERDAYDSLHQERDATDNVEKREEPPRQPDPSIQVTSSYVPLRPPLRLLS